jgi:hypothetical protein
MSASARTRAVPRISTLAYRVDRHAGTDGCLCIHGRCCRVEMGERQGNSDLSVEELPACGVGASRPDDRQE